MGEWIKAQKEGKANVLLVSYEKLTTDADHQVKRIADFLEIDAKAELVDLVVEQSTFKSMAGNNLTNLSWVPQKEGVPHHMRKGMLPSNAHDTDCEEAGMLNRRRIMLILANAYETT